MKIYRYLIMILVVVVILSCGEKTPQAENNLSNNLPTIGSIERLDPALDALVPANSKIEILSEGHEWTEGPVWVPALQSVLYSDIPNNAIYRWHEGEKASIWLKPAGYTGEAPRDGESGSNGLVLDRDGKLLLAQHGDRRIARLDAPWDAPNPNFLTMAGKYEGKRFNSPNDIAVRKNGDIYFTDPPYGLEGGMDDPLKELDIQGVYRLAADGSLTLLTDELSRPNGIGFSPDEKTLYIANSDHNQAIIMAFDVMEDGSLSNGRVFFNSWGDGMALDQNGNLYQTGPGGVMVISPEGKHLGTILTTQNTSNCTFGNDGSTLYITADMHLLRIRLNAKGTGF